MERRLEALEAQRSVTGSPLLDELVHALVEGLDRHPHFRDEVRADFIDLLVQTLHYMRISRNAQRSDYGGRFKFLYRGEGTGAGGKTLENDLADDFVLWLRGGPLSSRIYCEVISLGGGRVDILITYGQHRFVCEVKREELDVSRDGLSKYVRQAVQYQQSDVAIGMLLVLDLAPREFDRMLEVDIWLENVKQDNDLERAVVVALIPGDRVSPSDLSR